MLEAHVLAIIILGVSTFIVGSIPLKLARWHRQPFVLSLLMCFGAGILLATSLIHMLAEVRAKMPEFSELIFCSGFLLLYAIDEMIHVFVKDPHTLQSKENSAHSSLHSSFSSLDGLAKSCEHHQHRTSYGTINKLPKRARFNSISESFRDDDITQSKQALHTHSHHHQHHHPVANVSYCETINKEHQYHHRTPCKPTSSKAEDLEQMSSTSDETDTLSEQLEHCHVEVQKPPCPSSKSTIMGLLTALIIHSILEGCSIGVQTNSSEILLVLSAVACHKLVLAFCLGLELAAAGYDGFKFMIFLTAFAIGCPIGIGIGISATHSSDGVFVIEAPLQALAGGSLLYVAVFEVLPRERFKWQHRSEKKFATFIQMISVISGFAAIVVLNFYLDFHEHRPGGRVDTIHNVHNP